MRPNVLFTNVRILDGTGAQPYPGEVLVQGNRISRVGARRARAADRAASTTVDGGGATLMPGMVEAHTHFSWNDQPGLSAIQRMPHRGAHPLVRAHRQALPRHGLDLLHRRGHRQAAPRRGHPQRDRVGPDPGPALPGGQPGDHGAGRPRRRDAAAPAVSRSSASAPSSAAPRRCGRRVRMFLKYGVDTDQAEPLGRVHRRHARRVHADDRRGDRRRGEGGALRGKRVVRPRALGESVKQCVRHGIEIIYHASFADEEALDMLEASEGPALRRARPRAG